jgi:hypothetical protein
MVGRGVGDVVGVGVAVAVGDVVGAGVAVAVGTGVDGVAGGGVVVAMDRVDVLSCVGVDGVVRRGGIVGVTGMGTAASRRNPHPLRTIKAMLAPSASNPCRVSHPGVPRTISADAQQLKEQRPAP